MTPLAYATYFDKHYLTRGLALYQSLLHHSPPFVLWVLCLDEETRQTLTRLRLDHVRLVPLPELEEAEPSLLEVKPERLAVEYYWTCGPAFLVHVFARDPRIETLSYLDADLFFFGNPAPIYDELGANSILVVEHRKIREPDDVRVDGRFNVGLVAFRRTAEGERCLRRWRDQCLEWCFDRHEDGRFGDQGYLTSWPEQFEELTITQHLGAGVAPWNVITMPVRYEQGRLFVRQHPVIFYHFGGVRRIRRWLYELHPWRFHRHRIDTVVRRHLYAPYVRALCAAEERARDAIGRIDFGQGVPRSTSVNLGRGRLARTHRLGIVGRSRRFMVVVGSRVI